ncbi:AAA family ATPase [Streptomyces coffeae]|uniref:AAA family ATPase n=1 Tax=Streptomyces coffeae TaxID=621382 RepID=A0ABS1NJS8_9ACTN|nr:helix-turn-helix transcriptional regulator [Streptomyces coffeae]MBL1100230.1 AAA family ATPase [Streptomyces coffeae]
MLVQRESELTVLRQALRQAESGEGALLLLEGETGAGTTVLLRELAQLAEDSGACVLRSSGAQGERDLPLGVVRQWALPLLTSPEDVVPAPSRALLGAVEDGSGVHEVIGVDVLTPVLYGLYILMVGLSGNQTVVLVIDDLHWADEPSLRALAFLAARLNGTRVLIGVVVHDWEGTRDPHLLEIMGAATHRLRAEPLPKEATAKLLSSWLGDGCATAFALACHDVTGGNPKELRVLLDRAVGQRLRGTAAEVARVRDLGASLQAERMLLRLRRDPAIAAFAKAVVVLADQATEELVERLSGVSRQDSRAAQAALRKALVRGGSGRLAFRDPAMTQAIAESLGAEEYSRLHRSAAALLEECGAEPEEIAAQLVHVAELPDRWEIAQLRAAAVAARRRGAPEDAVRYLRQALLDLSVDGRKRAEQLAELAVAELEAESDSAVRHLAQAARLMPDHRRRAAVLSWAPPHVVGRDTQLAELVREVSGRYGAPETLHGDDRELALRMEARSRYAGIQDPAVLASAGERLMALGDTTPVGIGERELRMVLLHSAVLSGQVGCRDVVRMARQVLDHQPTNSLQLSSALLTLPWVLFAADAGDAAASWLDAALAHVRRQGPPTLIAIAEAQSGLVLLGRGQVATARESALRAVALADRDVPESMETAAFSLGAVAVEQRDLTLAGQAVEMTAPYGDLLMFALRRHLRGELAAARGDLPAARAQFLDCGRLLDRAGWLNPAVSPWQVSAALIHHRLGRTADAAELAEDTHRRAEAWGAPTVLGRALRVRGTVTDGPQGTVWMRQAVEVLQDVGTTLELSRALIALGKRLQHTTAPAEGERLLTRGRRLAEQVQRSGSGARDRGLVGAAAAASAPMVRSVLTPGEATVAEFAARGHSNQEIADRLEISKRAVEKHLTRSYRKLGIEGRSALAAALAGESRSA